MGVVGRIKEAFSPFMCISVITLFASEILELMLVLHDEFDLLGGHLFLGVLLHNAVAHLGMYIASFGSGCTISLILFLWVQ